MSREGPVLMDTGARRTLKDNRPTTEAVVAAAHAMETIERETQKETIPSWERDCVFIMDENRMAGMNGSTIMTTHLDLEAGKQKHTPLPIKRGN